MCNDVVEDGISLVTPFPEVVPGVVYKHRIIYTELYHCHSSMNKQASIMSEPTRKSFCFCYFLSVLHPFNQEDYIGWRTRFHSDQR